MARPRTSAIDFQGVARAALPHLPALAARWLPDGRRRGREWLAKNPTRPDESAREASK